MHHLDIGMWTDLQQSTQDIDGKQINNNEGQPDVFGFLTKEEKNVFLMLILMTMLEKNIRIEY